MKTALARFSLHLLAAINGCDGSGGESSPGAGNPVATVDVTGRWEVSIAVDAGTITGLAVLAQSGDSISGSMGPNDDKLHPLEGVVNGDRITLTMRPGPG